MVRSLHRPPILALIACAAATAAGVPLYALAAPSISRAPDLRADPVENIIGPAVYLDTENGTGDGRLLVRFAGFVTNIGDGPLEIRGNPQKPQSDPAGVKQYALAQGQSIGDLPSEPVATPEVVYENSDTHDHFHLTRAMRYSLWNLERTAQVAPGQKVGFCLYDLENAPNRPAGIVPDPQVYVFDITRFCDQGERFTATDLRMGVSSGWRDVYDASLAFQWVDVSQTSPGTYLVGSEADPDNVIWEGGGAGPETNLRAFAQDQVTVPGHVATPMTALRTGRAQTITLASTTFGTPGGRRFRIVAAPTKGTLSQPTDVGFAGPGITYTPAAGSIGADSFSYVAFDPTSGFPLPASAPRATVSLTAAAPTISISGAPSSLIAGTSAQLSATVSNAPEGVVWSTSAGTISPTGLLVAPASPPAGGTLTVRATSTSTSALSAEAVIAIAPAPVAAPAPLPPAAAPVAGAPKSTKLLSRLSAGRIGPRVIVGTITTGPKAGRIDVVMSIRGAVVGRCGARVNARKTVSCKITLARAQSLAEVRVTVKLTILGTVYAVRRAVVKPPR